MYIAIVDITGNINRQSLNSYMPVLKFIEKKKRIKGLLLIINSGGGDANVSEILYDMILAIGKKKKVYALIEGTGASGAYWIACAADKIYAMETSIVGSIGVISMSPDLSEFMDMIGIKMRVNKIGKYKDMNSPFREVTDEEQKIYGNIMNDIFLKFKNEVKSRRNYSDDEIDSIANGMVFSAKMALKNKLIDGIGNMEKIIGIAKSDLNVESVKNLSPKKPFLSRFIGMSVDSIINSFKSK
ncbi:MAG: signal peptide peptidase SppA [Ferroplasma sp.]